MSRPTEPSEKEMTTKEMLEHMNFLGMSGISCKDNPCPFCDAIRRIIVERGKGPGVDEGFVEKWTKDFWYADWMTENHPGREFMKELIVAMLCEAGVKIKKGDKT